jgi:hypothetical protein
VGHDVAGGLLPRQLDLPGPAVPFGPPVVRLDTALPVTTDEKSS